MNSFLTLSSIRAYTTEAMAHKRCTESPPVIPPKYPIMFIDSGILQVATARKSAMVIDDG